MIKTKVLHPDEIHYNSGGAVEEIFNTIVHALGAGLSIAGLIVLLILTSKNPDPWKYTAFSIYGVSQIFLYLSSAFTHGFSSYPGIRARLVRFDQAAIYLLIAGTYTPLTLTVFRGPLGWTLFAVVWSLAIIGVVIRFVSKKETNFIADLFYLPMGWMLLFVIKPLFRLTPTGFIVCLFVGGAVYSIGIIFYFLHKLKFAHVLWHLFVIGGSCMFFLGYALYIA